jgi:hypothetical protein
LTGVLLDHPTDHTGPRSIDCYLVNVQDFAAINGKKYEIDPQRQLYALRWLHNGRSPDPHLQLVRGPGEYDSVAASLLGALSRYDPDLLDALCAR